jgi:pantetheine-phosphate adenylyltransferase
VPLTAFYSGSFDPPTNGHVDIIARAAALVDRLVIGVGVHHQKAPFLQTSDRVRLLEAIAERIAPGAGAEIAVVTFDNLAVDAARSHGAQAIVRGVRNVSDFDYETQMAAMNASMAPGLETIFLAAAPEVDFISSTLVRQIAAMNGDIGPFVPADVARAVAGRSPA